MRRSITDAPPHTGQDDCPHCEELKKKRIESYIAAGLSRTDATLVDELSEHAVHKMVDALDTVAATAPPHLVFHVRAVGLQMAYVNLGMVVQDLFGQKKMSRD